MFRYPLEVPLRALEAQERRAAREHAVARTALDGERRRLEALERLRLETAALLARGRGARALAWFDLQLIALAVRRTTQSTCVVRARERLLQTAAALGACSRRREALSRHRERMRLEFARLSETRESEA